MKNLFIFTIIALFPFVLKGTNDTILNINDSIVYFDDDFYTENYDKYRLVSQVCNYTVDDKFKKKLKSEFDLEIIISDTSGIFNKTKIDIADILPFEERYIKSVVIKKITESENLLKKKCLDLFNYNFKETKFLIIHNDIPKNKLDSIKKLNLSFNKKFPDISQKKLHSLWCMYLSNKGKTLRKYYSFNELANLDNYIIHDTEIYFPFPVKEKIPLCEEIEIYENNDSKEKYFLYRSDYYTEAEVLNLKLKDKIILDSIKRTKRKNRLKNNEYKIDTKKEKKSLFDNIAMLPGLGVNYSTINDFSVDIGLMIGEEKHTSGGGGDEYYGLKFTQSFGRLKRKSAIGYHYIMISLIGFTGIGSDIVHFYDYDTKLHEFGLEVSLTILLSLNIGITNKSGFYFEVGI